MSDIITIDNNILPPKMEDIINSCYSNSNESFKILFYAAYFDLKRNNVDTTFVNIKQEINNIKFNVCIAKLEEKGLVEIELMKNGEVGYKIVFNT